MSLLLGTALQVKQQGNVASVASSENKAAAEAPEPAVESSRTQLPSTQEDVNPKSGAAANGSSAQAEPALTANASLGKAPAPAEAAASPPQHVMHDSANSNSTWPAPLQTSGSAAAGWAAQRTQIFVTDDSGPYKMVLGGVDPDAPPYEGPPFPPPDAEATRCQALQVTNSIHKADSDSLVGTPFYQSTGSF